MLRNYGQLIARLFGNLRDGSAEIPFVEFLQIIGNGILLMLVILLMLAIIAGVFWFPIKGYGCFTTETKNALNKLLVSDDADDKVIKNMQHSLAFKKTVYFILLFVIYLPVCIPSILYLLSLLFH